MRRNPDRTMHPTPATPPVRRLGRGKHPVNAGRPSRGRRWLFGVLTCLGIVMTIEGGARLALMLHDGRWQGRADWQAERAAVAQQGSAPTADETPVPDNALRARGVVAHPFFGFVRDPDAALDLWPVGPEGLYTPPSERRGAADDTLRIVVLGGSVANRMVFAAGGALAAEVARRTGRDPATVSVASWAMEGYKQPQQLTIAAVQLARGVPVDVIVNLDGFNDVCLPFSNVASKVDPTYPNNWHRLVEGLPDLEVQQIAGEITWLRARRRHRAEMCPGILGVSAVCQIVWRGLDGEIAARMATRQRDLERPREGERPFEAFGAGNGPRDHLATLDQAISLWQRSSVLLDGLATHHGVRYFHFLQPNQYLEDSKPMGRTERRRAYDIDSGFRPIVEKGYPLMRSAGEALVERGVAFHDLTMAFANHREPLYVDTCCHLNPQGSLMLAGAIAAVIAEGIS